MKVSLDAPCAYLYGSGQPEYARDRDHYQHGGGFEGDRLQAPLLPITAPPDAATALPMLDRHAAQQGANRPGFQPALG